MTKEEYKIIKRLCRAIDSLHAPGWIGASAVIELVDVLPKAKDILQRHEKSEGGDQ
jgi:hypothetical protein